MQPPHTAEIFLLQFQAGISWPTKRTRTLQVLDLRIGALRRRIV